MPQKIIIDTDPGVDDTLAILVALRSPELDVIGLTAVFGNGPVSVTAQNARRVLEIAGCGHVPVAAGAARPLVRPPKDSPADVHGADALGDAHLPPPAVGPIAMPAAQFIAEQLLANPGEITLVALGPQTNLALALQHEPRVAPAARAVVFMGGALAVPGNVTSVAEANIYNDPEAVAAVLSADWPVTMVGLDVTRRTVMTREYIEALGAAGTPESDLLRRIFPVYQASYDDRFGLHGGAYTHDPSAMGFVIDPSLFRAERRPLTVETTGESAGQIKAADPAPASASRRHAVCVEVDSPRLLALLRQRVLGPGDC